MMASAPSGPIVDERGVPLDDDEVVGKIRERDAQCFVLLARLEGLDFKQQQLREIAREGAGELARVDLRFEARDIEDEVIFDEHGVRFDQGRTNFRQHVFERRPRKGLRNVRRAGVFARAPQIRPTRRRTVR